MRRQLKKRTVLFRRSFRFPGWIRAIVDLRGDGPPQHHQRVDDQCLEFVLAGIDLDGGNETAVFADIRYDGLVVGDAAVSRIACTLPERAAAAAPICFEML